MWTRRHYVKPEIRLSVLSDTIRVQFQITLFFCQNLPFIILSTFLVIVTNPKIKKGTTKLWPKQDSRGVTTARELCVGTNKSKMKARINLGTCYKIVPFRALPIHSRESKIVREKKIPNRLVRYQRDPSKSFKDRGKVESWKYCDQTTSNLDNVYRLTPL